MKNDDHIESNDEVVYHEQINMDPFMNEMSMTDIPEIKGYAEKESMSVFKLCTDKELPVWISNRNDVKIRTSGESILLLIDNGSSLLGYETGIMLYLNDDDKIEVVNEKMLNRDFDYVETNENGDLYLRKDLNEVK